MSLDMAHCTKVDQIHSHDAAKRPLDHGRHSLVKRVDHRKKQHSTGHADES